MIPPLVALSQPPFQSLTQLVKDLNSGQTTSRLIVEQCLNQIQKLDHLVKAWVKVYAEEALAEADQADQRRRIGQPLSQLDGIPFGVKDIIDVCHWPTVAGFTPWQNNIAGKDAAIISTLRGYGLIPLGKTVTTQFASIDPPATTNPYNTQRTPGGSSSGSCAAVACRMVPLALGSQTGGSINRPASFCGVAGLKMTFGKWPVTGVVPCSPSLDTLGPIVPHVADLLPIFNPDSFRPGHENHTTKSTDRLQTDVIKPLRIARLSGRFAELADPEMLAAVDDAESRLRAAMNRVETIDASDIFNDELWRTHRGIMLSECATTHQHWFADHPEAYLPKIRSWVEEGKAIGPDRKIELNKDRERIIRQFFERFQQFDAILVPAARGEAPTPETTGDPVFNAPWTLLGVPSLTVPVRLSSNGLPLSVQLAGTSLETRSLGQIIAAGIILDQL